MIRTNRINDKAYIIFTLNGKKFNISYEDFAEQLDEANSVEVEDEDGLEYIIEISGTTYSLSSKNIDSYIRAINIEACVITVPTNKTDAIPIETVITIRKVGIGGYSLLPEDDTVTLNGNLNSGDQHTTLQLVKVAKNEWDIIGGE